jgi:predicted DNA-binding protein with PD1-like motif
MHVKEIHGNGEHTLAIIFDQGDEVISTLTELARERALSASRFTAIGAFRNVVLGYFDWERKDYRKIPIDEQVEVLALTGDISLNAGEPKVHAHVVLGRSDGTTRGGHLLQAHVRPTLEVMLTESPAVLRRSYDQESGLALIDATA